MGVELLKLGAQSRCPFGLGGAGPACGSKCISGLHPSGPHAHVWVEALLAPLLPVPLSVKGQLANEHLHLAWWQETRTAVVQVCTTGKGGGGAEGPPPGLLSLCAQWPDSDRGELGLDDCAAGQCPGTEDTLPHYP